MWEYTESDNFRHGKYINFRGWAPCSLRGWAPHSFRGWTLCSLRGWAPHSQRGWALHSLDIHFWWVFYFLVTRELAVVEVTLKFGLGLAKIFFYLAFPWHSLLTFLEHSHFEYFHVGLTSENIFRSKKYCFLKWTWLHFLNLFYLARP